MIRTLLTAAIGAAILVSASPAPLLAQETLKIGAPMPAFSVLPKHGFIPWVRAIEKDSGGAIKFQEFWGGKLIRSPAKQYEAMINGIQDATVLVTSYTQKLFPDFSIFALPYLVQGSFEASVAGWELYKRGLLRGLDKLYVAAVFSNDLGGIHVAKKIHRLEGLENLKIRVSGPGEADLVKSFGAVPVGTPMPTTAESLNRGVIEGSLNGWGALRSFRVVPLIKSHIKIPLGVRSFLLVISKSKYDSLSADKKAAIDKNSGASLSRKLGQIEDRLYQSMVDGAMKDPERNVIELDKAGQMAMEKRFKRLHDAWIKETPDGAKKYAVVKEVLAKLRSGKM